jgi:TetR/AcrR family transcriptional regulator, copper-responsive repressor
MRKVFESGGTLAETLMKVYEVALSIYFSNSEHVLGCFVVGTAVTEAPIDPEIRTIAAQGFRALDADFEVRFEQARADGELKRDADPQALAMLASATMHSMAIRARSGSSRNDLKKLAQKAVKVICG